MSLLSGCNYNDRKTNESNKKSVKIEDGFYEVYLNQKFIAFLGIEKNKLMFNDQSDYWDQNNKEDSVLLFESVTRGECSVRKYKSNYYVRKSLSKENNIENYSATSNNGNEQKIIKINIESEENELWSNMIKIAPKTKHYFVDSIYVIGNSVSYPGYTYSNSYNDKTKRMSMRIPVYIYDAKNCQFSRYLFNRIISKTDSINEFKFISKIENNNFQIEIETFYNPKKTKKVVDSSETYQNIAIKTMVAYILNAKE